jgi:hypothetical protein
MADISGFWTTGGTSGDQQVSYTQAQWSTAAKILAACSGFEGVAPGFLNALACTVTGANTVAMNTGGALVDGKWYFNDASQDINIPSASAGTTRIDRIVLRAAWSGYTVAPTVITGTSSAPAITQTSGTTYDILMYQASVTDAGVVTLTDERTFAGGFGIRQGGDASAWRTYGTTNYTVGNVRMQCGSRVSSASTHQLVTFPIPFTDTPLVFTQSILDEAITTIDSATASGCYVNAYSKADGTTRQAVIVQWLAIGPA